jgi:hypothetical protein
MPVKRLLELNDKYKKQVKFHADSRKKKEGKMVHGELKRERTAFEGENEREE